MKTFRCGTVEELVKAFDECGPDTLFRGQTKEYLTPQLLPSIVTSFSRHGCIPERMLKWSHYSKVMLGIFVKNFDQSSDLAIDQAILQHYGWRSFFVDATSNPAVAAWFAANSYSSQQTIELCEDCDEMPLFKVRDYASYAPHTGNGVVYAISRKALRAKSINAVDLVEITTVKGTPRFSVQDAFMVGPLGKDLPTDCITAKIIASAELLAEFSVTRIPNISMEYLFPGTKSDPVLKELLSLPWVKLKQGQNFPIDYFARGLPLPEYAESFVKISHPRTAYYRRYWLPDIWQDDGKIHTYLTNEIIYHGTGARDNRMPHLESLILRQKHIVLEFDGLAYFPLSEPGSYSKGIYIELQKDKRILITELLVIQEGGILKSSGITRGIYYEIDELGEWITSQHEDTCDCGSTTHHAHHFKIAQRFEDALKDKRFKSIRPRVYADTDVDPISDPWVIKQLEYDNIEPSDT